jgi:hypothetical protein
LSKSGKAIGVLAEAYCNNSAERLACPVLCEPCQSLPSKTMASPSFISGCTTVAAPSNSRAQAATLSLVASLRFNCRSLMTC